MLEIPVPLGHAFTGKVFGCINQWVTAGRMRESDMNEMSLNGKSPCGQVRYARWVARSWKLRICCGLGLNLERVSEHSKS